MDNCDHPTMELRHRPAANHYVRQCLVCGWTTPPIAHDKIDRLEREAAAAVDDSIRDNWYAAQQVKRTLERKQGQQDFFEAHSNYLRSPEWKARRVAVLRRDGYICQACLQNEASQVHHLTYKHWGHEPLFELVSVCKPCHDQITTLDRSGTASRPDGDGVGEWEL